MGWSWDTPLQESSMHDPRNLLLFLDVVDEGSMAGAARKLGMSRSTVARHVATLEDELGVQLLHRNTRDVSLSEAGELYVERAREIRELLAAAEACVHQMEDEVRGRLRVAVPIVRHRRYITPIVSGFGKRYPDVELEILFAEDISQMVALGIDVGIQTGLEVNAALTMRRLAKGPVRVYASPAYLADRGTPTTLEELSGHDAMFMRMPGGGLEEWPLRDGGTWVVDHPKLVTNSRALLVDGMLEGLGLGRVMGAVVAPLVEAGRLVEVMPEVLGGETSLSLVYAATRHVPPKVRAFVDFTLEWSRSAFASG
jgi:DNA-binding transcriptional LysR family regulator